MTSVVVAPVVSGEPPTLKEAQKILQRVVEGAVNKNCTWKQGWEPNLIQSFVKRLEEGKYQVFHNLSNPSYALSLSLVGSPGNIQVIEQDKDYFTVLIKDGDQKIFDCDFRFAMCINEQKR